MKNLFKIRATETEQLRLSLFLGSMTSCLMILVLVLNATVAFRDGQQVVGAVELVLAAMILVCLIAQLWMIADFRQRETARRRAEDGEDEDDERAEDLERGQ